jgi:hypothetical protein
MWSSKASTPAGPDLAALIQALFAEFFTAFDAGFQDAV